MAWLVESGRSGSISWNPEMRVPSSSSSLSSSRTCPGSVNTSMEVTGWLIRPWMLCSARANSMALWKRSRGSLAIPTARTRSSSSGTSARIVRGVGMVLIRASRLSRSFESPGMNMGLWPISRAQTVAARE